MKCICHEKSEKYKLETKDFITWKTRNELGKGTLGAQT